MGLDTKDLPARLSHLATIGEAGALSADPGSRDWAIAVRLKCQALLKDTEVNAEAVAWYTHAIASNMGYRHLVGPDGRPFTSYRGFCEARQPWGLGYDPGVLERLIAERKTAQQRASEAKELPRTGTIGNGRRSDNITPTSRGSDPDYLAARIKRDYPDIHERLLAGEYTTLHAAALDAGLTAKRRAINLESPASAARTIANAASREFIRELIAALQQEVDPQ